VEHERCWLKVKDTCAGLNNLAGRRRDCRGNFSMDEKLLNRKKDLDIEV
jgi:hypothetical protein